MRWQPADWTGPRFAAYQATLRRLVALPTWPSVAELDAALAPQLRAVEVRLVEPPPRGPEAPLYELQIADRREVPTRPGDAHDLWNAVVWATFPAAKWALTAGLAAAQRRRRAAGPRLPGTRTPDHDRRAMLDEGGLLVAGARAVVFGHAILEHAARGVTAVRAARLALEVADWTAAAVDAAAAAALNAGVVPSPGPGTPIDDAALAPWVAAAPSP
ncbi:MAG: DUF3025 domain-containing protein [Kofleriaceae bacterium]